MKPEDAQREIKRLEDRRMELAPEVMGGNPSAVKEDRGLERRIMELASAEREGLADELREASRRRHLGGLAGGLGETMGGNDDAA